MKIEQFSKTYQVRALEKDDVHDIYALEIGNPLYFQWCPPFVTEEAVIEDMESLPPGKTMQDKYYVGFYQNEKLTAVMDLIDGYPEEGTAFIGFFMMDRSAQGHGTGSRMINELCLYLTDLKYQSVQLAWIKGNPQAEHFWKKNGFQPVKETISNTKMQVILAQRTIASK